MRLMLKLWNDDAGFGLLTMEALLAATIIVLGIITGLVAVRQALISELTSLANAILELNQSFSFSGQTNCESSTAGSAASQTTQVIHEASVGVAGSNITQLVCD